MRWGQRQQGEGAGERVQKGVVLEGREKIQKEVGREEDRGKARKKSGVVGREKIQKEVGREDRGKAQRKGGRWGRGDLWKRKRKRRMRKQKKSFLQTISFRKGLPLSFLPLPFP